jgi:hypothetical protein
MAVSRELLATAASIIADYREGEISRPDVAHVEKWLSQFDGSIRESLLTEMNHVLSKTYVSKKSAEGFLVGLATLKKLAGDNPKDFWVNAKFLDVQKRGKSQRELLSLFETPLKQATGLGIADCGQQPNSYIYLDDGIFTGMTLIQSLTPWLKNEAPQKAILHVIVMAGHAGGKYYAETNLKKVATAAGKDIDFHWWALLALEDRKANINISDVLRPTSLPDDARARAYAEALKFPPVFRTPGSVGEKKIFSSEDGRNLLEQQLLIKGAYIKEIAPRLPKFARPLGDMVLETLGFGSTFVTYRNCPNNAPLAFWAGDPWYPLFPRKTN